MKMCDVRIRLGFFSQKECQTSLISHLGSYAIQRLTEKIEKKKIYATIALNKFYSKFTQCAEVKLKV